MIQSPQSTSVLLLVPLPLVLLLSYIVLVYKECPFSVFVVIYWLFTAFRVSVREVPDAKMSCKGIGLNSMAIFVRYITRRYP